jgi:type I restriction enzyme, S subunit
MRTSMGGILELVREPVDIDPATPYRKIGIRSFGNGIFHYDPMPGDQLGKLRFFRLRANELVLSNIKAWEGAIAVSGEADEGLVASNRFLTYRPRTPHGVDVRYLKFFLLSDVGSELIQRASPGSADRNRTLGMKAFEAIEISIPGIEEQRAIATRLESVQVKSTAARAELKTAAVLYGKLVSSLVHRPDLSEAEKNRRGWRRLRLDEVLTLDIDAVPIEDDVSYPMVGVYSFGRGLFNKDSVLGHETSYQKFHRLETDQIVLSRLFAWEGAIALVALEHAGRFASIEFPTFSVNEALTIPGFLQAHLGTESFWGSLRSEAAGVGVRRQRVSADRFLARELWLPPLEVQAATWARLIEFGRLTQDSSRREMLEALVPSAINATFADFA